MSKPWLASYPEGIPAEVDVNTYDSLIRLFEACCEQYQDKTSFSNFGTSITYSQLDQYSRQLAAFLQNDLQLAPGDRIAIMMPNLLQNPVAIFAALRAGLTVVNTNPLYTSEELEHQLNDSGACAIIVLENFASTLADIIDNTAVKKVIVTRMGDMLGFPKSLIINAVVKYVKKMVPAYSLPGAIAFRQALQQGAQRSYNRPQVGQDDYAFLQYTGGTTGVAKGAILTHGNLVANLQQVSAWLDPFTTKGTEKIITALPLYHIFSLTANCLFYMKLGAENVLITNPRDMKHFVKEIKNSHFTAITGVNTLFNGLLHTPGFDQVDFSTLRITLGGGMAVQKSVAERWKKVTGCPLIEAYGLTETSPAACINPMDLQDYNGKIGLPIPSTDCCIQDDNGKQLPTGETGEICIRGPQVTQGYYNRPDETEKAFDADGWFHTGDLGFMDEQGYFQIVDRKKDMIGVSGFNVYPNEVEAVIASHPSVIEVGVIGLPNEDTGEEVTAVVVSKDIDLTLEDIRKHCEAHLTRYKLPKKIIFADEVPKSNVGKILRRKLREQYMNSVE
jgi:long-chain acyl-CoA synthetase